jgi:hypothetical protein
MDWRGQNENKTLSDTQVRSQNTWDERYSGLLRRMDDYQEEKDNPRKQVVDMEMEELYVPPLMRPPHSQAHGFQILPALQVVHRSV